MNYNYEKCIVMVREGKLPKVYDYLYDGETSEDAEERGFKAKVNNLNTYLHHHEHFPNVQEDGTEYWQSMYERESHTEYKAMSVKEFQKLERTSILENPLEEITEECFQEMLDILPPLCYVEHKGVVMFCMSEFYTGSYTMQYAKEKKSGKYYRKLVDFKDKSTWICEQLANQKIA